MNSIICPLCGGNLLTCPHTAKDALAAKAWVSFTDVQREYFALLPFRADREQVVSAFKDAYDIVLSSCLQHMMQN